MKSLPNIKPSAVRRLADWLLSAPDNTEASRLASPSTPTAPELCDADTSDRPKPTFTLTGAQLLEALDLVAPDRTVDQLECEASFQYGDGHDGKGMYCWITEYPEEGATKLDSSIAQPIAASVATLVMQPLTDAAMREALDDFELICENNDVRRLTDAEKYAAQEFALSLVHADPSGAPVAEPTCKHIATWADGKCTDCGAKVVSDDELTQRALAYRDIDLFGQAFMIDGKRIDPERVSILSKHAVAADGAPTDDLLQLDVLLAKFHEAIWRAGWRAGAGDDDLIDFDLAGKDEAKAIQRHVRAMLAERAAVSPATASGLPAWFDTFLTNVCEIPDRSSPEGEPDAIIATLEELKNCALNAIEECAGDEPATADRICTLIPLSERHPVPDEHPRVIAFTDGSDFNGAQFFDVPADSLNECFYESPDEQPEVCRHATHWMPRPSLHSAAPAPAEPCAHDYVRADRVCTECGEKAATAAARDVLAERARQVSVEGWTPEHDDQYTKGELAQAASLYAVSDLKRGDPPLMWPWHANWWKPTTPRRNRVKATALMLAEIERLDRAEAREQGAQDGKGGEA
ncbi:hypothetical protein [Burkholderia gladioli]|uniref:hypothetical protein n=1 Tax=Burkholderia gladioli TaxID=28095 RepID=UPI001C5D3C42|nr:hypothetical protein [Burkholderia gladioli]MBW5284769.1 hypothetical protein [Burkholderia gladioli]